MALYLGSKKVSMNFHGDGIFDAGKKAEWDMFWDSFQENGNRTAYAYAFMRWGKACFKPKHPMLPTACNQMFQNAFTDEPTNLVDALGGVELDTSNSASFTNMYGYSGVTETPSLSTVSANTLQQVYNNAKSWVTGEIVLRDDGSQTFDRAFASCTGLQNLVIRGKIGQNGFNVQWSNDLTHDSLMSIINALDDKSEDTGGTWTVTIGTTNYAKLTDEDIDIARNKGWTVV